MTTGRVLLTWVPAVLLLATVPLAPPAPYFPPPGDTWERRPPSAVGMDSAALAGAVAFAIANESKAPRALDRMLAARFRGPWDEIVGPVQPRGDPNGLVLRHGYIVAEWGDTRRVDMTFSVTERSRSPARSGSTTTCASTGPPSPCCASGVKRSPAC